MASPLSTHFNLSRPPDASVMTRAREQLAALGVTRLEDEMGVILMVTYDPSRITNEVLLGKLRSLGIPVT